VRSKEVSRAGATDQLGPSYRKLFGASTISNLGDGVGQLAYPWLASAVTRNPLLVAMVAVVQRLPWLLFSLPAGVITDRYERRSLMVVANAVRAVVTLAVALLVLAQSSSLPSPAQLDDSSLLIDTNLGLYAVLLIATMILGTAEVLYDNTAQTIMPSLVREGQLERANGRLWSAEQITNTIMGPALGAFLLALTFSMPFFFDAVSFTISAFLIVLIPRANAVADPTERKPWKTELADGFRWLWGHDLLRPLAVILGLLNLLGTLSGATLVLFAQEVLGTSTLEFALLSTAGAVGGVAGGWSASWIAKRIGPGPSMFLTLIGGGITSIVTGLSSSWPVVWVMFALFMFVAVLWNVITVSLRQAIIPDHLLGRVNSVYRFFAWGMMPIGALLGGAIIVWAERLGSRETALRLPWIVAGVAQFVLLLFAAPKLTTSKIEAARGRAA
jgi:MFS family permease